VYRALTAPGSLAELAGEREALAAFRAAAPRRARGRFAARIGAGGSVFIAAAALSGGVAAASYTGALPDPAQRVLNDVAGWAGVPAPAHHHHHHPVIAAGTPEPTPLSTGRSGTALVPAGPASSPPAVPSRASRPTAAGTATPGPSVAGGRITPSAAPAASPALTPTAALTTAPTAAVTPPAVAAVPAMLTIATTATRVPANGTVTVSGQLTTSSGAPVPDHQIVLIERVPPGGGSTKLGSGTTDSNGEVSFGIPAVTRNVRLVLRAGGGVHSQVVSVVEVPTVSVTVTPAASDDTVTVSTVGATVGDEVILLRGQHQRWTRVAVGQLDSSSAWMFSVPVPAGHSARYRVVLDRTTAHAAVAARFVVPPQ
jgi:hypothetical protein